MKACWEQLVCRPSPLSYNGGKGRPLPDLEAPTLGAGSARLPKVRRNAGVFLGFEKSGAGGLELLMIYRLARLLQLLGLILLPVAISGELAERLHLKQMLLLAGVGMLVFFLGWLLQQTTKRP